MERGLTHITVTSEKTKDSNDREQHLLGKGVSEEKIVAQLKECSTETQIDRLFDVHSINDYKMRNTLLREAMECTIATAGVSINQEEDFDSEERQKRYYITEKDTFLLIRGFYRAQDE